MRLIALLACVAGLVAAETPPDALARDFQDPPMAARPHTWWHWMSGNISRAGITTDLEAMRRVGLAGAQIFNVAYGPKGPVDVNSPAWLELMHHAASEAQRLGLELCFHNCAGWSSAGGPWVTPDQAMRVVAISETKATGPRVSVKLPQPKGKTDAYRDIAVFAVPGGDGGKRLADIQGKALFVRATDLKEDDGTDAAGAIPRSGVIDLTTRMKPDGSLEWNDAPEGPLTILRIGHVPTGKTNHPAPPEATGLETDKLDRAAVDAHWAKSVQPVLDRLGPLAGTALTTVLVDSYEEHSQNWTPRLVERFKARCGYDPTPFLPALTGRIIDNPQITERFLWDFRTTIAALCAEEYYGRFATLCHERGLKFAVEPYGDGPFVDLACGAHGDLIMGEFWAGQQLHGSPRLAAAVAHTNGRRIVGAEAFTAHFEDDRWTMTPWRLKDAGDQAFCAGINRMIMHRWAHQPWPGREPGMTMGPWGFHFEHTNTWFEPGAAWVRYLSRCQVLLQAGLPVADVCYFIGEGAPLGMRDGVPPLPKGYASDACDRRTLMERFTVQDGRLTLPDGMSYRLLVLPPDEAMTLELVQRVRDLATAGATIMVGSRPRREPGLGGAGRDAAVKSLADELWGVADGRIGKGRLVEAVPMAQALAECGSGPDVDAGSADLGWCHRRDGDRDLYFIANRSVTSVEATVAFRVQGRRPELWWPDSGRCGPVACWTADQGVTRVPLRLEPRGSVFVVFSAGAGPAITAATWQGADAPPAQRAPARLVVVKAVYEVTDGSQPVEVTAAVAALAEDDHLQVAVGRKVLGAHPAKGKPKRLRIDYVLDGVAGSAQAEDGKRLVIPAAVDGKLKILGATYGTADGKRTVDVAAALTERIFGAGCLRVRGFNDLAGDPAKDQKKQLVVEWERDGRKTKRIWQESRTLTIPDDKRPPTDRTLVQDAAWELLLEGGRPALLAAGAGTLTATTASGATLSATVAAVPEPIAIAGAWELRFPPGRGAPERISLDRLASWHEHADDGVRHFSGTATYALTVDLPATALAADRRLILDLGWVWHLARVTVNGQDLGVMWKPPFRVDATAALKPGANDLRIAVTNLWPNRLIGDDRLPDDGAWKDTGRGQQRTAWPAWLTEGKPDPSGRTTFAAWKHWTKDDALLPSGLVGPVTLRTRVRAELK